MKQSKRRWVAFEHSTIDRAHQLIGGVVLLGLLVLSACGGVSDGQTGGVPQTSDASPQTTASVTEAMTPTPEMASEATSSVATTVGADSNFAPVTAIMEKLGVKGEQFAALGDPNAPVTMIEFSDYGCPFCRRYVSTTYPELKQQYIDTGKVYYVFKDYPIKQLHPQAEIASQAAECAGEQGKYWEMHAALFANPGEWDTTEDVAREVMTRYAAELNFDAAQFASCMEPGTTARADVEANMDEGRRLGLTGTPSFVINGKLLAGAQPLDVFQRVLTEKSSTRRIRNKVGGSSGNGIICDAASSRCSCC